MKLYTTLFICTAIIISFQICYSQAKPKTELVEEVYSNDTCEYFSAITDSFLANLSDEPNSTGYAVIYPTKKPSGKGIWYEKLIIKSAYSRKLNNNQLRIIHGESREKFKVEFWNVPSGEEKPLYVESKWSDKPRDHSKTFLFDRLEIDGVCQTFVPEFYADFIKANSNITGKIIIFDSSKSGRKRIAT